MRPALLFLASAVLANAAIEGTVVNGTTGKPQAGVIITVMNLGAGMDRLGTVKTDEQGKFRVEKDLQPGAPHLVQALHQGVTYNEMVQPGAAGSGIQVQVYDASAKAPDAKITQHMILLEPSASEMVVNQSIVFSNTGKVTYQDPQGTLRFQVPDSVTTPVQLRITAPQGMPINRQAEKASEPGVYAVRYPIKPGETRIDVLYSMSPSEAPELKGKILHSGGPVRFVAPQGVTLAGDALTSIGNEPQTQATIYELKGTAYDVKVQGTGSLRASAPAAAPEGGAQEEDPTGGIDIAKPRMNERAPLVIGLTLAMLAVGFVMLYRASA